MKKLDQNFPLISLCEHSALLLWTILGGVRLAAVPNIAHRQQNLSAHTMKGMFRRWKPHLWIILFFASAKSLTTFLFEAKGAKRKVIKRETPFLGFFALCGARGGLRALHLRRQRAAPVLSLLDSRICQRVPRWRSVSWITIIVEHFGWWYQNGSGS